MSNLSDLLNSQPVSARQAAAAAEDQGIKLPYGTIAAYWSGKHGRPSARTLKSLAAVLPIPLSQLQQAAWGKATELGEYRPPREADLLDARQRRALDELIRSIVAAKEARDEDQSTQDPQGDPTSHGEAGTDRAPMTARDRYSAGLPEHVRHEYDQVTCGILAGLAGSTEPTDWPNLPLLELHRIVHDEYDRLDRGKPFRYLTNHRQAYAATECFTKIRQGREGAEDLAQALSLPFGKPGTVTVTRRYLESAESQSSAGQELTQADVDLVAERGAGTHPELASMSHGERMHRDLKAAGEESQDDGAEDPA